MMTSKYASNPRTRSTTKTLYTPVFYARSQSSASGSIPRTEIPEAYLDYLSRKHIALAQVVQEVPSSRCGSPVQGEDDSEHSASKARVEALQRRVKEAFKYANGDPADGKWGLVVQLLRLNTTRRRRWLGSTTAGKQAESSAGWINARSEKEWDEWEGKWQQEMFLKQKVQSWQEKVDKHLTGEPVPIVSISQDPEDASPMVDKPSIQPEGAKVKRVTTLQTTSNPSTTLGFPVVKRSSLNVVGKPKPSGKPLASGAVSGLSKIVPEHNPHDVRDPVPPIDSSSPAPKLHRQTIEDISESSFLPPSFPSQLQSSTPNAKTDKRHKPEPIILVPPSSPLSTPPSVRVYGRQRPDTSSSLPELPSTPSRHPKPDLTSREKRPRSVTPQYAIKKARTASAVASSNSDRPVPPSTPPPPALPQAAPITPVVTPKRAQLPTLTELLASAKKAKSSPKRQAKKAAARANSAAPPQLPHAPQPKLPEPAPELVSQPVQEPTPEPEIEAHDPGLPQFSRPDAADPSVYERLSYNMGMEPGMAPEYDYDMASPTKSLSSLAASDSDEEQDMAHGMGMDLDLSGRFEPPFASTQAGEKGLGWLGYNSQFDVDGKVDVVSRFMEKDVDYDGWLKDPSAEADVESQ